MKKPETLLDRAKAVPVGRGRPRTGIYPEDIPAQDLALAVIFGEIEQVQARKAIGGKMSQNMLYCWLVARLSDAAAAGRLRR